MHPLCVSSILQIYLMIRMSTFLANALVIYNLIHCQYFQIISQFRLSFVGLEILSVFQMTL